MNKKGFSLIVLVFIIIIMSVLTTVVVINGETIYQDIEYIKFTKEIEIIEKAIKKASLKGITEGPTINDFRNDISIRIGYITDTNKIDEMISEIEEKYGILFNEEHYHLVNEANLINLGIKQIKGEYIVNYANGIVFSMNPITIKNENNEDEIIYSVYNEIPVDVLNYGKRQIDARIREGTVTGETSSLINNNFTVSIDSEGIITLNGRPSTKVFIKITDGIAMTPQTNNIVVFSQWISNGTAIATGGQNITQKVTHISGTATGEQINVCLRNIDNTASIIKCMLMTPTFEYTGIIDKDVNVGYIYATEDTVFNDYKIKVEIYEEEIEPVIITNVSDIIKGNLITDRTMESKELGNKLICTINNDYSITLDGKIGSSNTFVKLSNGIAYNVGSLKSNWTTGAPTIANASSNVRFTLEEVSGTCKTGEGLKFNACLRGEDNAIGKTVGGLEYNCLTKSNIFLVEGVAAKNLKVIYLFISAGTTFTDYNFIINIENI